MCFRLTCVQEGLFKENIQALVSEEMWLLF